MLVLRTRHDNTDMHDHERLARITAQRRDRSAELHCLLEFAFLLCETVGGVALIARGVGSSLSGAGARYRLFRRPAAITDLFGKGHISAPLRIDKLLIGSNWGEK